MSSLANVFWPAGLDQIVVFWDCDTERRALITGNYNASFETCARLLRRVGADSACASLSVSVRALGDVGSVLAHRVRGHRVGLMRPWLLSPPWAFEHADSPALIVFDPDWSRTGPALPLLARSSNQAHRLVRGLRREPQSWRVYECERLLSVYDRLILELWRGEGLTGFRSDLERAVGRREGDAVRPGVAPTIA